MSKTIYDWYQELPDHIRRKALMNARVDICGIKSDSLYDAIAGAFDWEKTPEGKGYWENVQRDISKDRLPLNKNKTVREWLSELEQPYRLEAIRQLKEKDAQGTASSLSRALQVAFPWSTSRKGSHYWHAVYTKILAQEEHELITRTQEPTKTPDKMSPTELEAELRRRYQPGDVFITPSYNFLKLKSAFYIDAKVRNYGDVTVDFHGQWIKESGDIIQGSITVYQKGEWKEVTRPGQTDKKEAVKQLEAATEVQKEQVVEEQPKQELVVLTDQIIYLP